MSTPVEQPDHPSPAASTVCFAGGGSGGHLSPGLAIAERLAEGRSPMKALFLCSDRDVDAHMLDAAGVTFVPLPARPPSLRPAALRRFVTAFRRSRRMAREQLISHGAARVVALGGFVAAPVAAAARDLRIPVTLLNLDDPPGRANRWMARRCSEVWSARPLARRPGFASRIVGMPVRHRALAPAGQDAATLRTRLGLPPDVRTLLVTGASQGSRSINGVLLMMLARDPETFRGWQAVHLAGPDDAKDLAAAYDRAGVPARVEPFLDEIGVAWGAADLAISRAGANSVAEAEANAVPTLFLPYPFHRDRHQANNARPLVERGAAMIVDDLVEPDANHAAVGPVIRELMTGTTRRHGMRDALRETTPPDAAAGIAASLREACEAEGPRR